MLDRDPRGRRHRARPRRRQRRGPAAVLRRDAVPRRRRVPHPGRLRDRARAGHAAGRPRRRPALLDADRGRPAAGARPAPRRPRGSPGCATGPGGRWPAGWTARSGCSRRCGTARCWPIRCAAWRRGTPRSSGCATRRGRASSAAWTGAATDVGAPRRPADGAGPGRDAGPRLRGRAAGTGGHDPRAAAARAALGRRGAAGTRLRVRVADGAVGAVADDGVETGAP